MTGVAHGLWTGRWQASRAVEGAVVALGRVPQSAGEWEGQDVGAERHTSSSGYPKPLTVVTVSGVATGFHGNRIPGPV